MAGIYADEVVMQHESALMRKADIQEEDKLLITKFVNYKTAEVGISQNRANKFMRILRLIATRYLKGSRYENLTRDDVVQIVAEIERSEMKAWTKHDYKLVLRMFLEWLDKDVSWIKVRNPRNDLRAEDMLTEDEVRAMIDAAASLRDKALVATLYDGGFRISELGEMRIKDVKFDNYGSVLIVRGKTGMRRVRIISASPYLSQWLNTHPLRDNRDAPLWVSLKNNDMMNYFAIRAQLQKIAKRAGIEKKVNPHNFRHSRASYLASHLTESQMDEYLGWIQGSDSPRVYVHMSGRDVDTAIMEMHGLGKNEKKSESTMKKCLFCETLNTAESKICYLCKRPLEITAEGVLTLEEEVKELREKLTEFEEIQKKIQEFEAIRGELEQLKKDLKTAISSKAVIEITAQREIEK